MQGLGLKTYCSVQGPQYRPQRFRVPGLGFRVTVDLIMGTHKNGTPNFASAKNPISFLGGYFGVDIGVPVFMETAHSCVAVT